MKINGTKDNLKNKKYINNKEREINDSAGEQTEQCAQELDTIEALKKENQELKDKIIRKTAELDNAIKRSSKEKMEMIEYANEALLEKLLVIMDDIANAVEAGKQSHDPDTILTGVEMIANKLTKLLEEEGVKPLENPVGKQFDVDLHDALMSMPSDLPEGAVIQEIQKGYKLRDKVMRHSKVITSNGQKSEEKDKKE